MGRMASEDRVDCDAHDWVLREVVMDWDGSHLLHECRACGAEALEGPDELTGRPPTIRRSAPPQG